MEKKRSCCCGELPAMWWWLLTLLGLPLLFFLATSARQGVVEKDLTSRSTAALKAAGMDWATVNLDQRGRDVQLNGMAASPAVRDEAFKTVQNVYGVRDVQNLVEVATAPAQPAQVPTPLKTPDFSLQVVEGKIVLQGVMGSQQEIDAAVKAVQGAYGKMPIDNQMQLADGVAPADWLNSVAGLLPALQGLENASLKVSAAGNSIGGDLPSEADKAGLLQKAQQVLGAGIADQLAVKAPAAPESAPMPAPVAAAPTKVEPETAAAPAPAATPEQQAVTNCQQQLNDAMTGKTVLFETNKSAIKQDSLALLDSLVSIISSCQPTIAGHGIQISGHTDNVGNDAYNQKLSQQRAGVVKNYFVKKGIDGGLVKSVGLGESKPIASNDDEAGRSQNRRITFDINP
jgi:outer membrane protein OmpA-like peptidoglycan-associated protein/osmotically-inducible protein OsmY